ncbi:MAG TPA: LacI family DNA-binding transcriptional regulator [Armatimonadota bacterium]|jgi:LacI family transcriptional regulator
MEPRKVKIQRVTLRTVAEDAGVHSATAAVILNGARSSTVVSAETRQRVLEAAARLGYRPNRAAQALRRQRSMTVGLSAGPVQNPFFVEMATLCEGFLLDAGYELMMTMDAGRYLDDQALLETLVSRGVDGIIYWSERETAGRRMVEDGAGCPVVIFGYPSPKVDSVTTDFGQGAVLVARHLMELGRRRLAYLCPSESLNLWSGNVRLRSFCDTVMKEGLVPSVIPYESTLGDISAAREAAEALGRSKEPPDGILCFNDLVAVGAIMGLRRAGLSVPRDVALAGFDNIPLGTQLDKPLTTVDLPLVDICRTAVDLLLRRLQQDDMEPQSILIQPRLMVRGSTLDTDGKTDP